MLFALPILMIGLLLKYPSLLSASQFTPPTPAKIQSGQITCAVSFLPLDEDQTMIFDQPNPEPVGYCQVDENQSYACALRSCANSAFCSKCSNVTSGPEDQVIKTNGKVIPGNQECALAYYISSNSTSGSLCLTYTADVLQCTGPCVNATSCATCLKVKEEK